MTINLMLILFSAVFVAVASGIVSSILVMRRMTLVSDALSHVALPGIALGVIFHFQPILGGMLFLFLGILIISGLEAKTKLVTESVVGVVFTVALAIGSLLVGESDLLEAFFGDISKITNFQIFLQTAVAILVIFLVLKYLKNIILLAIAPDLLYSIGVSGAQTEFILLMILALIMTISIGFVGVLLMSSLLIIPGVAARQLASSFKSQIILSVVIALISLIGGIIVSVMTNVAPGPIVTLISGSIFILTLVIAASLKKVV
jgi:ABC-type Mn2+/Zn2+ transport system permease subunit